jgi:hypothetical protein
MSWTCGTAWIMTEFLVLLVMVPVLTLVVLAGLLIIALAIAIKSGKGKVWS